MNSYSGASYDQFVHRSDDSKAHRLKSAYWTTKQVMIKKFKRKEDENVVASDSDLDAKLELLKSVQKTCRELMTLLLRYQDTLCYLSQSESEMGRFLKRNSMEDRTQAGKIMAAAGKALSHSAQQRLLLRTPLERVLQEVKTFRQRAISDTVSTLNRMEAARTEYRGALLWMKHISEELDPDTYKQLEKFRRVQAQVKKTKSTFDRLKIDSMQKIDLLSASRCNMLSHALVGYQNSLLTFLERTSRTMVAVADRFQGYQYYEFSVLKHLLPESKRLAGLPDDADGTDEDQSETNTSRREVQAASQCSRPSEEELDRRLEEIFEADGITGNRSEHSFNTEPTANPPQGFFKSWEEILSNANEEVPPEHRDLLTELFGSSDDAVPVTPLQPSPQGGSSKPSEFEIEWESVFSKSTQNGDTSSTQPNSVGKAFMDDPWNAIRMADSTALPSQLWDQRDGIGKDVDSGPSSSAKIPARSSTNDQGSKTQAGPTSLDAWMKLFSDLGQIGNPDAISKKDGQITDA